MVFTTDDGVVLHAASGGEGPDVVVLCGGPGCVHYLADESIAPAGFRCRAGQSSRFMEWGAPGSQQPPPLHGMHRPSLTAVLWAWGSMRFLCRS